MEEKQSNTATLWKKPYFIPPLLAICVAYYFLRGRQGAPVAVILREALLLIGYIAAWIDLREKRVPNQLILALLGVWVLMMVPQLFLNTEVALQWLIAGALGFALGGLIMLVTYLLSRKGLGGADVKLMTVAGLYLGVSGILFVLLVGSILSAVVGVVLVLLKKQNWKGQIAFIPFLYIGILVYSFLVG